jgi:hypothetical protein
MRCTDEPGLQSPELNGSGLRRTRAIHSREINAQPVSSSGCIKPNDRQAVAAMERRVAQIKGGLFRHEREWHCRRTDDASS